MFIAATPAATDIFSIPTYSITGNMHSSLVSEVEFTYSHTAYLSAHPFAFSSSRTTPPRARHVLQYFIRV
jgi:hypothetical protein